MHKVLTTTKALTGTGAREVAIVGKKYYLWLKSKHFCPRKTIREIQNANGEIERKEQTVNFLLTSGGDRNWDGDKPNGDAVLEMLVGKYGPLRLGWISTTADGRSDPGPLGPSE